MMMKTNSSGVRTWSVGILERHRRLHSDITKYMAHFPRNTVFKGLKVEPIGMVD